MEMAFNCISTDSPEHRWHVATVKVTTKNTLLVSWRGIGEYAGSAVKNAMIGDQQP